MDGNSKRQQVSGGGGSTRSLYKRQAGLMEDERRAATPTSSEPARPSELLDCVAQGSSDSPSTGPGVTLRTSGRSKRAHSLAPPRVGQVRLRLCRVRLHPRMDMGKR